MSKLKVLVLHQMGDPRFRREAVRALEYMIPESRDDINCIVHDASIPFPEYLKSIDWNLIVLGPTFLCNRYNEAAYNKVLEKYSFISHSSACKIALPQDDYDCSGILDEWMITWSVDRIYTVCPEHWDVLYPKSLSRGIVKLGYTGYISDEWIKMWKFPKDYSKRSIDVSYRASKLPPNFGSIGQLKWEIADRFLNAVGSSHNLMLDISVNPKDMIAGLKWHEFVENSRFCLATPSGSSILDPYNNIRKSVNQFLVRKPKAEFTEIEEACFPGVDRDKIFVALSPRNIEAALAETVQIATPSSYSNLMIPIEHFIPLNEDCSNIKDVMSMMRDRSLVLNIRKKCKDSILSEYRLRRSVIVNEIINFAESITSLRNFSNSNYEKEVAIISRYNQNIEVITSKFWKYKRYEYSFKNMLLGLGSRVLKNRFSQLF